MSLLYSSLLANCYFSNNPKAVTYYSVQSVHIFMTDIWVLPSLYVSYYCYNVISKYKDRNYYKEIRYYK